MDAYTSYSFFRHEFRPPHFRFSYGSRLEKEPRLQFIQKSPRALDTGRGSLCSPDCHAKPPAAHSHIFPSLPDNGNHLVLLGRQARMAMRLPGFLPDYGRHTARFRAIHGLDANPVNRNSSSRSKSLRRRHVGRRHLHRLPIGQMGYFQHCRRLLRHELP